MTRADRTIQLRRYRIVPGELDGFVDWFRERLLPARLAYGYSLEFAYALPESNTFVWAVSVPGDVDALTALDASWQSSDERAAVFAGAPRRIEEVHLDVVLPVA